MKKDNLAIILIALTCFSIYLNSLGNAFVFDDIHTIKNNLFIKNTAYIPGFFQGDYTSLPLPKCMFRPLLLLTFSLNYLIGGLQPYGYHLINILLHFLNGTLLYSILKALNTRFSVNLADSSKINAFFGLYAILSILFIAHPLNTETVSYITCRSDLLVTFFILSGFLSHIENKSLLVFFSYLCALLTKETALIFPLLLLAYDFLPPAAKEKKKSLRLYTAIFLISASYWLYRNFIFNNFELGQLINLSSPLRSFYSNILLQTVVTVFYLRMFIWPHPLTIHHTFPNFSSMLNPIVFLSLSTLIIMITAIFVLRKRYPLIGLGVSWYLICLLPKFYAVLYLPAAEHHFYLPSIGLYIVLVDAGRRLYLQRRKYFFYLSIGTACIFAVLAIFRNREWNSSFSLWKSAVKANPASAIAQHEAGIEHLNINAFAKAEIYFHNALSLTNEIQTEVASRLGLAKIRENQNKLEESEKLLNEALRINPKDYRVYLFLGGLYQNMKREDAAKLILEKGLTVHPESYEILERLGLIFFQQEKLSEAKKYLESAARANPDAYSAYFNLGQIYEKEGKTEESIKIYKKSIKINPEYVWPHYALGTLYAQSANPSALWHLKETVKIEPQFAAAHNNLAVFYYSMEPPKLDLAREHAQKALSLGYPVEKEFSKLIGIEERGEGEVKN